MRLTSRSAASTGWELDLLADLDAAGFLVPTPVPADDGRRLVDGVVVQRWVHGRPPTTEADWAAAADRLRALHELTAGRVQRPGCCTILELARVRRSVDADLDRMPPAAVDAVLAAIGELPPVATAVVHGDPGPGNIRLTDDGSVGLLDWDESRVDVVWHDLSNLGIPVLPEVEHRLARRLSDAWEAANGWSIEPAYARRRLARLTGDQPPSDGSTTSTGE